MVTARRPSSRFFVGGRRPFRTLGACGESGGFLGKSDTVQRLCSEANLVLAAGRCHHGWIARNRRRNSSGLGFADWVATALGRAFERDPTILICNCHACGAWTEGAPGLLGIYRGERCFLTLRAPARRINPGT